MGQDDIARRLDAIIAEQSAQREVLAALAERLRGFDTAIERFYVDQMAPMRGAVTENTLARERTAGAIKLAVLVLGISGSAIVGVGGWMVRTTLVLEQRQEQTTEQVRDLDRTVTRLEQSLDRGDR
jgi:hypothetical protein